ncbi:MAG TPA: hypothetical protein VFY06_04305 [Verrucomicrobiae bacterium]|nr:hypothetical protein [Verrucomicrobiae bacterium]
MCDEHEQWRVAFVSSRCYRESRGRQNTRLMKKLNVVAIILVVGIGLGIYLQQQSRVQTIETETRTDAERAGDAASMDVQKVDAAATKVGADVASDVRKTESATTNVVGEVKEKLP